MIGTVMMSSSSNNNAQMTNQATEISNMKQSMNNGTHINSISHMISNGQDYPSDTEISERGGQRSNRSNATSQSNRNNQNKNGQYVLNGNSLSYDQQSISSTTASKMLHNRMNNSNMSNNIPNYNQMRPSKSSSNQNNHQNYSNNNTMNSRKMSERSVNFDEENYAKLKIASNQEQSQNVPVKMKSKRANGNNENPYGNGSSHYGGGNTNEDEYESNNKLQVQILPQDDNWGENTTAFTADFSDFNDDMTEDGRSQHHFNGRLGSSRMMKDPNNVFIDIDSDKHQLHRKSSCFSFRILSTLCSHYFGFLCAFCVSFCAFLTPIMFIILPRLNINQQWQVTECGLECEGLLIGIAFKLFILLLGAWAIFLRKPRTSLPRIYELRALLIFLLCIMTFSYWLFYAVRIIDTHSQDYHKILQFAVSYVDVLLFIFIVSVFILELRQIKPEYVVKIVRSPDGEQSEYLIGKMSIQRAAIYLLEQYYKDFNVYNPWLDNAHKKRGQQLLQLEQQQQQQSSSNKKSRSRSGSVANFNMDKEMDKDNDEDDRESRIMSKNNKSRTTLTGGNLNANDRFYEEYEYERRLRKRRARLMTSTEEAFTHIKRINSDVFINDNNTSSNTDATNTKSAVQTPTIMDPFEAAQAVFTSIARDLRRYLRVTRQQPFYTRDSIIAHLANCLSYDMSPKSFLQRYLNAEPLIFNERALVNASAIQQQKLSAVLSSNNNSNNYNLNLKTIDQSWILICDIALYQNVEDNLMLVLKQNEVSLMCTFKRLPRFNLIEDILDPTRNKFVLKLNSETTV